MTLPINFKFSQHNLQNFVDCPRRFELKYLLEQEWPALVSEPVLEYERLQQLGLRFHTLVQQHLANLPSEKLEFTIHDSDLLRWWQNYLDFIPKYLPLKRFVEYSYHINIQNNRLMAKYDLLVFNEDGTAIILDWKTTQRRTPSILLKKRMQSIVYPYVLAEANKMNISPENIQMFYWFADFPNEPEQMIYSSEKHAIARDLLTEMVEDIQGRKIGEFPLTEDKKKCKYCNYRSLCDRGIKAGDLSEIDENEEGDSQRIRDFTFDEIAEIEF